jgi:hypothetical protein
LVELDMEKMEKIAELENDCNEAIEELNMSIFFSHILLLPFHMGSTICTLPEIVLIQVVYFFQCVSRVLSTPQNSFNIFLHSWGSRGSPFFQTLEFLFWVILRTNWYTTICILDTNLYLNVSKL